MDKIFITGSTGFVGVNLSKYLKMSNHEVIGVSRFTNSDSGMIDYLDFELKLKSKSRGIIHLAGKAHDLKKTTDANAYFEINYELTKKVFDAFLSSESDFFIYMSSVKAVKDFVDDILTEEQPPTPVTAYGQSKLKSEEYILANMPANKRIYILRPCMIHGPGNKGNLNLLYKIVEKGLPWPLGSFENQRSFLSIENLCFVINELLENSTIPSGVYQVADDEPLSTNALIALLGQGLGSKNKIWKINPTFIKSIAKIGDAIPFLLNTERLQKLTESYVVSNAKILSAIGKSLPVSAKEGLAKTFKSFIH